MKIKILAVGKIKEKWYAEALAEYVKRLDRFAAVEISRRTRETSGIRAKRLSTRR